MHRVSGDILCTQRPPVILYLQPAEREHFADGGGHLDRIAAGIPPIRFDVERIRVCPFLQRQHLLAIAYRCGGVAPDPPVDRPFSQMQDDGVPPGTGSEPDFQLAERHAAEIGLLDAAGQGGNGEGTLCLFDQEGFLGLQGGREEKR